MPDSGAIDAALSAKLQGDATLMALATDGVWADEAPAGKTRFVIFSLVEANDEPMFGLRAFEDATYLVKYVEQSASATNARTAANRIDTLLEQGTLAPTGYSLMTMRRISRITPTVEVDEVDTSIRWQHRGGLYQIVVSG